MKKFGALLLAISASLTVFADETAEQAQETKAQELPLAELRIFAEVLERIRVAYVEPVEDKELLENAIVGMLQELDPHSDFLRPQAFEDLQETTTGEFGGLGIEVGMENGFVKVISPIEGTPAQRAGIEAGDLIIKLDDTPVKGMSLNDAVDIMRGPIGSDIELTIIREGADKPLEFTITRDKIVVTSTRTKLIDNNYAYLRINQFQSNTGKDVEKAVAKMLEQNELHGMVLDLRNNPGGVLNGAAHVSDIFLSDGDIVSTKGRAADTGSVYKAEETVEGDMLDGLPIVVLVNGGSASASEIVAGALQDHKRAVVMGTKTFGKGSVQTVLPLHNDYALKLTTALYYTPHGKSIQAEGIVPDIVVEPASVQKIEYSKGVKEANLKGHIENSDKDDKKGKAEDQGQEQNLEQEDYQLSQAINLLKGIYISRKLNPTASDEEAIKTAAQDKTKK